MPRSPMLAGGVGALLQDLSLAAVMEYLPREDVRQALVDTRCESVRERLLPADVVAYLVVMLALYSEASVRENLRILMEPLRRKFGVDAVGVPTGGAITKARKRLGAAPFVRLFEALARPLAVPGTSGERTGVCD